LISECEEHEFYNFYTSPETASLFGQFFTNSTIVDGFASYWDTVSKYFASNEYVIGYDVFNEPWPGNQYADPLHLIPGRYDKKILTPFYDQVVPKISRNSDGLVFYEPNQLPDFLPVDGGLIFPVGF